MADKLSILHLPESIEIGRLPVSMACVCPVASGYTLSSSQDGDCVLVTILPIERPAILDSIIGSPSPYRIALTPVKAGEATVRIKQSRLWMAKDESAIERTINVIVTEDDSLR